MELHRPHIKFSLIDYVKGKLTSGERNKLEREAFRDPFLSDAMDGLENMPVLEIEKDLNDINTWLTSKINKKGETKRSFLWIQPSYYRIAASILIVFGLSISGYLVVNRINQGSKQEIALSEEVKQEKTSALLNPEEDKSEQLGEPEGQGEKQEVSAEEQATKNILEEPVVYNSAPEVQATEMVSDIQEDELSSQVKMKFDIPAVQSPVYVEQQSANEIIAVESSIAKDSHDDALSQSKRSKNSSSGNVITGTVIDESGQPMIGVGVKIKGTNKGTVTNIDGEYKIEVPNQESELEFSYVGYFVEDISVGNQEKIDYKMTPEQLALEEVVVVGYGTQKKSDLTGSIASVSSEDLTQNKSQALDQALQGKVAGVSTTRQNKQQDLSTNSKSEQDCNYTPYPEGGFEKFETFLASDARMPEDAEQGKEYVIILTLSFTEKGIVKDIKVKESPGAEYSNEAIRLINQGPYWVPAHDGNCNPINYTMDYTMKLTGR